MSSNRYIYFLVFRIRIESVAIFTRKMLANRSKNVRGSKSRPNVLSNNNSNNKCSTCSTRDCMTKCKVRSDGSNSEQWKRMKFKQIL